MIKEFLAEMRESFARGRAALPWRDESRRIVYWDGREYTSMWAPRPLSELAALKEYEAERERWYRAEDARVIDAVFNSPGEQARRRAVLEEIILRERQRRAKRGSDPKDDFGGRPGPADGYPWRGDGRPGPG
jgi:hypothetical protein